MNSKPGRHEVLEIHYLRKNLHLSLLVNLLLVHSSHNLTRRTLHTNNDSMREFVLLVGILVDLHNDGLLTSILARENDYNLSGLKTLHHLRIMIQEIK